MLSILRTLAIQISTNKRRRLGFVDELVNRNFIGIAHSVTSNAKCVTSGKSIRFVTQSFTKMSRKSPHCDSCSISPCGNEVFGGSTNTKFNEFLCNSCAIQMIVQGVGCASHHLSCRHSCHDCCEHSPEDPTQRTIFSVARCKAPSECEAQTTLAAPSEHDNVESVDFCDLLLCASRRRL